MAINDLADLLEGHLKNPDFVLPRFRFRQLALKLGTLYNRNGTCEAAIRLLDRAEQEWNEDPEAEGCPPLLYVQLAIAHFRVRNKDQCNAYRRKVEARRGLSECEPDLLTCLVIHDD
jgi:hypothetical protein